MSLESNIADLNTATAGLLTAINTQKAVLDTAVASTTASASAATASATQAATAAADALQKTNISKMGGVGDFSPDGALSIACGDSTTEQFNANDGASAQIVQLRQPGEIWSNLVGFVNFGGSGYTLAGFVNDPLQTLPVIPTIGVAAISNWDYYGHKPSGAISLATALAWRSGKADRVLWRICYGINDVILYASTGNLSKQAIVDYLAPLLRTAITRILASYPRDSIVLDIPNPMTARPFVASAGFPSPTAYPNFGNVLADDQALIEKWNQALRATYLLVQNEFPKTLLIDSWLEVFGNSNTTLNATTQLPFLNNLVHPSGKADAARIRAMARRSKPKANAYEGRRAEAELRATALAVNPWDVYPGYFRENVRYKLVADTLLVAIGTNYIDVGISTSDFALQVTGPFWLVVGDLAAQYFPTYTVSEAGSNTRILNVAPTAAMQAANSLQTLQIYTANTQTPVSGDAYVNGLSVVAKEYVELGNLSSGGNGYIDMTIASKVGRVSTKFLAGLTNGVLVVGGSVKATFSLAGTRIARNGATSDRSMRLFASFDFTNYSGQPAAITFADDKPSPKSFERVPKVVGFMPHAIANRAFVFSEVLMTDGAVLSASLFSPAPATVTIDVYSLGYPNRTLIGTITIASNTGDGVLATGNPAVVNAGTGYEFVVTSSTSSAGPLMCSLTPS